MMVIIVKNILQNEIDKMIVICIKIIKRREICIKVIIYRVL